MASAGWRFSATPTARTANSWKPELAGLDNVTIYTFLLPFQGEAKPIAIWCAADRASSLAAPDARWRRRACSLKTTACDHPIGRNLALARQLGVQGTPTLIWADGTRSEGFVGRAVIEARLAVFTNFAQVARGETAMKTLDLRLGAVCLLLPLAACMNMSGLGGDSKYACKAPDGVACDSVSGTYANALHNNLPSQQAQTIARRQKEASEENPPNRLARPISSATANASDMAVTPSPLRTQARILRLWIKPWEDADGDLYDQGYVYVQVDNGQWQIDHVQRQIRDRLCAAEGRHPSRPLRHRPPNPAPVHRRPCRCCNGPPLSGPNAIRPAQ
jgi:conjugal transfer pilus assembly protein TraV